MTTHSLVQQDCRDLSFIRSESVELVITHPPAFGCHDQSSAPGQLSAITAYREYLAELDSVWAECARVLAPGGYLACVASSVAMREDDLPAAADVFARTRRFGLDLRRAIRWLPSDSVALDDSDFYGAPNQPCGEPICRSQDVLVMRKPGERRIATEVEVASRMAADYFALCASSVWLIPADIDPRHPQSFPLEFAERLIRAFSYAGDTVLDPFAGIGTTSAAAMACGRNSISVELEPGYFESMAERIAQAKWPDGEITITRSEDAAGIRAAQGSLASV